jgi:UDP-N-acetylglucosamine 2-epimerase (non-hydrolysing)
MPEELNRLVTDVLADILWTPSRDADENLLREGIAPEKIQMVGNIMIDSLEMLRGKIENQKIYLNYGLKPGGYGVVTLHRPSNVDNPDILKTLCENLRDIAGKYPSCSPCTRGPARTWRRITFLPPWKAQKTCSCPHRSATPHS